MEPIFDGDFSLSTNTSGNKTTFSSLSNVAEYVNPQCTDKRYSIGFMTPEPSPTDATPRRKSFALSENRTSYFSGSSGSSFISHSGCGTPSQSTPGSSASNSRRQSMLLPESQYYLSAIPSSPSNRPQRLKRVATTGQYPLQDFSPGSYITNTDTSSLITDSTAACTPGGEFATAVDSYTGKAPGQWQNYDPENDNSSLYDRAAQSPQIDDPTSWNPDLVVAFNTVITERASHTLELGQPLFSHTHPTIFEQPSSQPNAEAYDLAERSSPNAPSLAPAWEYTAGFSNFAPAARSHLGDSLIRQPLDDSSQLPKRSRGSRPKIYTLSPSSDDDPECDYGASRTVKNRNKKQKQGRRVVKKDGKVFYVDHIEPQHKNHQCRNFFDDGSGHMVPCDYACNRPEHLRRHEDSKHRGAKVIMLPCKYDGCNDRKTNERRKIRARGDNLKAHYTKTHFKYGNSEKGGKNERKSMKAAHKMGLGIYDQRWTLLLEGKMDVNHEIQDFLHVWKMLGYSIRETRDTRVKDVYPDWQGSEDDTLQKYDPRWNALWNGTLTFDQAMSVGQDMKESEAQGLLGVTMLETEEMGIRHLDVRWVQMDNDRMSVEQSEKLGVKQRNPVWKDLVNRRKARGWVEKFC